VCYIIKIISLILLVQQCISPQRNVRFEHFGTEEGLSSLTVLSILQDSRGFLWIGTYDGLNRYDGYSFKIYRNVEGDTTSLSNNAVRTITEDQNGDLWLGTWSGGVNKFNRKTETFTRYYNIPGNSNSLISNSILSIDIDTDDNIWIGTSGGLSKFDKQNVRFTSYQHDPKNSTSLSSNAIFVVLVSQSGKLWIGTTGGGLNLLDPKTGLFEVFHHEPNNVNSISDEYVISLYEDDKGHLWIGTRYEGLDYYNTETNRFINYKKVNGDQNSLSDNGVFSITEDYNGDLWVGTYNGGLNRFNIEEHSFTVYDHNPSDETSLTDNGVFSVYIDKSSIIWAGTWSGGLNKYLPSREKFRRIKHISDEPNSLSNNSVRAIYKDTANILWIGTERGGLNAFDKTTGEFKHYPHGTGKFDIDGRSVETICEDSFGNIWVGTDGGGINKIDKKTGTITHYNNDPENESSLSFDQISVVYEDKQKNIWIGTSGYGLNKLDTKSEKFSHYKHVVSDSASISHDEIFSIYEDSFEDLWIGTFGGGLNRFNKTNNTFERFRHNPDDNSSLSNDVVVVIFEDNEKTLWIGTSSGLNYFNRNTNSFSHYKKEDGLPNEVINGILEDDHSNLWLSTNNGIVVFNKKTKTITRTYDKRDGLSQNEFNQRVYFKYQDGVMYFGGNKGINYFHPDELKINDHIPDVRITAIEISNKPVPIGEIASNNRVMLQKSITETNTLELTHDDNVLSLEFSSLDYCIPSKNKYAYKLEGFIKDWTYTDATRRFVTYTNLDQGEYVFRVIGSNNDEVWNEEGSTLSIIVYPPWWLSTWAYVGYGLFFILLLISIRTYDLKRQRLKHELELEHKHAEKLEEVDQMKSRFFANISHEFRTPLTLILGPAEKISPDLPGEEIENQTNVIKRKAKRLLDLINQLLDLSKLEAGKLELKTSKANIVSFIKGVTWSFESVAEEKDITLKVKAEKQYIELYFDKEKMTKIMTNLLSNAFKFTPAGGKVTIILHETDRNSVEIKVNDTGIGIHKECLSKLFNRFYQVDSSHTREGEGTGLGLALTKELIELHHGKILVDSKPGNWTEFTIEMLRGKNHLNYKEIVEEEEPVQEDVLIDKENFVPKKDEEIRQTKVVGEDKNIILIVEDNHDMREYIKESLINNYTVEEAVNGEQGVRISERIIPDIIISDIMMPKKDGYELTSILKNDEKTSHIPILLLTAKSDEESKIKGLETEADAYLTKPFDTKELQLRIKNLINLRRKLQMKFSGEKVKATKEKEKKLKGLDEKFMKKVDEVIEMHISDEEFNIEDFGKEVGMSRMQIHRKLKALTGKSATHYIRSVKLNKAKEMIEKNEETISEIAYSLGFSTPAYFSRCFKEEFGHPPSDLISK
jgi:signal transduction histidine kinase/ligand-binding sensor domain-containing protein/DNA-binding response OmpR family regulator